nr:uncharacterized protein LOC133611595 isoform X1 [Nerophis lumbriciformis]XP_061824505.1 uncharacterized protein LOC133611595 isoform X1 [Nerophis lumbriciformis]XP_061824507.1 uncharacterized protein LOC133611595 isoform X1 [Nerophis lumbriciformis]
MFGLRTKKQITTQFSPYFLMFGREARYPSEVAENFQVNSHSSTFQFHLYSIPPLCKTLIPICQYYSVCLASVSSLPQVDKSFEELYTEEEVMFDLQRQEKILAIVQKHQEKAHQRTQAAKNRPKTQFLQVGDMVWRRNVRSQQRKGGKLDPDFLGPFCITKIQGKSIDLVSTDGKPVYKVNADHLRKYVEEGPRIPAKLRTCSTDSPAEATPNTASPATTAVEDSSAPATAIAPNTSETTSATSGSTKRGMTPARGSHGIHAISHNPEQYIKEAWGGQDCHILLSKIGRYKLWYWDINRTGPNKELESEVINAYLHKLVECYNSRGGKQAAYIDSFAITMMWQGKKTRVKLDPNSFFVVLGAVHEPGHCFFLQ